MNSSEPISERHPDQPANVVDVTISIAAYREAENLRVMLPSIKAAAAELSSNYEVLVVDTQQPMDDAAAICQANGVRYVQRSGGNSYGDAVRSIIKEARGTYILNLDADGSHSPKYFASMWAERSKFDIVIGSRYVAGGHTENPIVLIWMSYVVNLTFRIVFSIHAKDVTNSFRLYRKAILKPMTLQSNDFDILEEILIKAVTHMPPAKIGEVPIVFEKRKAGESKRKLMQFAFGYLTTLGKLRKFQKAAQREMKST